MKKLPYRCSECYLKYWDEKAGHTLCIFNNVIVDDYESEAHGNECCPLADVSNEPREVITATELDRVLTNLSIGNFKRLKALDESVAYFMLRDIIRVWERVRAGRAPYWINYEKEAQKCLENSKK